MKIRAWSALKSIRGRSPRRATSIVNRQRKRNYDVRFDRRRCCRTNGSDEGGSIAYSRRRTSPAPAQRLVVPEISAALKAQIIFCRNNSYDVVCVIEDRASGVAVSQRQRRGGPLIG